MTMTITLTVEQLANTPWPAEVEDHFIFADDVDYVRDSSGRHVGTTFTLPEEIVCRIDLILQEQD